MITDIPGAICRLEQLLETPTMKVVVEGGGIPISQSFVFDHAVLIGRGEVEVLLSLLKTTQETKQS